MSLPQFQTPFTLHLTSQRSCGHPLQSVMTTHRELAVPHLLCVCNPSLPALCSMKDELQRAVSPVGARPVEVRCASLDSLAVLCWAASSGGEGEMVECVMERVRCCWGKGAGASVQRGWTGWHVSNERDV